MERGVLDDVLGTAPVGLGRAGSVLDELTERPLHRAQRDAQRGRYFLRSRPALPRREETQHALAGRSLAPRIGNHDDARRQEDNALTVAHELGGGAELRAYAVKEPAQDLFVPGVLERESVRRSEERVRVDPGVAREEERRHDVVAPAAARRRLCRPTSLRDEPRARAEETPRGEPGAASDERDDEGIVPRIDDAARRDRRGARCPRAHDAFGRHGGIDHRRPRTRIIREGLETGDGGDLARDRSFERRTVARFCGSDGVVQSVALRHVARHRELPAEPRSPRRWRHPRERAQDSDREIAAAGTPSHATEHEVREILLLQEALRRGHSRRLPCSIRRVVERVTRERVERLDHFDVDRKPGIVGRRLAHELGVDRPRGLCAHHVLPCLREPERGVQERGAPTLGEPGERVRPDREAQRIGCEHGGEHALSRDVDGGHHHRALPYLVGRGELGDIGECRGDERSERERPAAVDLRPRRCELVGNRLRVGEVAERGAAVLGGGGARAHRPTARDDTMSEVQTPSTPSVVSAVRYLRAGVIARGGLGVVELVVRAEGQFRRLYALKRLHPHLRAEPEIRAMFTEEARIAGLIHHPNVVAVLDVGEDDEGPFLLMEYIDGLSLSTVVNELAKRDELIPLGVGLRIARQAAEGLRAAHELVAQDGTPTPAIHRDVSPQNVLVGFDGIVRVVDFGIAKAIGGDDQTTTHALKGKYGYMSPEQLRFERPDPRSDLFALGVVTWELLAGRRLYPGKRIDEVAQEILHGAPPELVPERSDVPPELEQLLFSMLSKDRNRRTPSARAVIEAIDAVLPLVEAQEGAANVRDFLVERFADVREKRTAERAEALRNLGSGEPRSLAAEVPEVDVEAALPAAPARARATARLQGWRLAIVLLVGGLIGAGTILALQGAFSSDAATEAAASPEPDTAAADPVASPAAPSAPAPAGAIAEPPAVAEESEEGEADEATAAEPADRPRATRRTKRRRATGDRSADTMQATKRPLDDWWDP